MQLGQLLLIACLFCTLVSVISSKVRLSKWSYIGALVLITAATALLVLYQIRGDFQYSYVYQHTSSDLPLVYRISALWAGQEGSFLLWACITLWMNLFVWNDLKANRVYQIICCSILLLACLSQPFTTLEVKVLDGLGLNNALMNPWMVLHPPIIFVGYTAMAIVFAQSFNRVNRKWVILSWAILGAGLLTGSIWAYQALGWGGFWAWDPIENLALVPWLLLSVFVHERELTLFQARISFVLAVFGTFMVRSGILAKLSVHSYATSKLGIPIFIVLLGLLWFILKGIFKKSGHLQKERHALTLKDSFKILMYLFALIVFIGTLCPVITGVNTPISIFNTTAIIWAIIYSLRIIRYSAYYNQRRFILGLVIGVGFVICISIMAQQYVLWALLILLCVSLPLVLQLLALKKVTGQTVFIETIHIGLSILIISIIVSSIFSREGIWLQALKPIEGRTIIIHQLFGDMVVQTNGLYEFKPMISWVFIGAGLMFIGGFLEAFRKQ